MVLQTMQKALRKNSQYVKFRELMREGPRNVFERWRIQNRILKTSPVKTANHSSFEVHALTWRKDYLNLLWALKSFYYHSEVDFALNIHDGGLLPGQADLLKEHFPNARILTRWEAGQTAEKLLTKLNCKHYLDARRKHIMMRKLDYFLLGKSDWIIMIDSDICFFQKPEKLLSIPNANLYNKDMDYFYCMAPPELESIFGVKVVPHINAGLGLIKLESMDIKMMDEWLAHPCLTEHPWLTEQTLHALCSSRFFNVELLPDTYQVSTKPGLVNNVVCKHFPGTFRPLLYQEGMRKLVNDGFLEKLTANTPN